MNKSDEVRRNDAGRFANHDLSGWAILVLRATRPLFALLCHWCFPSSLRRFVAASLLLFPLPLLAQESIVNSKHNLSVSSPGTIRASNEQQVCIFCHTPHNAAPVQPLWNRQTPAAAYTVYSSNSLQASPGQPTGASKLCLSCHDGTIALGSVVSRSQPIAMAGGMTTLPPGHTANIGTDLSDDHPISFRYDADLVVKNPALKSPATLDPAIRLDHNAELQCTTCHDAHDNRNGKFLVIDNAGSQLCKSCHQPGATAVAAHDDCSACHQSHTAASGPYLLRATTVTTTCTGCHGGQVSGAADIQADIQKLAGHDTNSPVNLVNHVPDNLVCSDCHEPHTMQSGSAGAGAVPPNLGKTPGISAAGSPVAEAQYLYEVCFRCHGDQSASQVQPISRVATSSNKRLQFASSAVSYHPVEVAGRNSDAPSLIAPLDETSTISCTDCHASDTSAAAGGSGPNGPHGSNHASLLMAAYLTADNTSESQASYALCYRCHDRGRILTEAGTPFPLHKKHLEDQIPCSACHDSHGIASSQGTMVNNAHLINFDRTIVSPDTITGKMEYRTTGPRSGECSVNCHGKNHSAEPYGP